MVPEHTIGEYSVAPCMRYCGRIAYFPRLSSVRSTRYDMPLCGNNVICSAALRLSAAEEADKSERYS